jgi:hypothetical protein
MTRQLTLAEQTYLFRVASRMAGIALDDQKADVVDAIRTCMEDLDLHQAPSRDVYRAWFAEQPVSQQWPTPHAASEAFDHKWLNLRATVNGAPVADMRGLAISRIGSPAQSEALLRGLRRWRSEDQDAPLFYARFKTWAQQNVHLDPRNFAIGAGAHILEDVSISPPETIHLAFSPNTYIEHFGSWFRALALAEVPQSLSFDDYVNSCKTDRYISDETIFEFLRDAERWAQRQTGRPLTRASLDKFRQDRFWQNWMSDNLLPVPSGSMIAGRFGGLVEAMQAGGIWDEQQVSRRSIRRGAKLQLTELAAYVIVCADSEGAPLSA